MNNKELLNYIQNPVFLDIESLEKMKLLIKKYPYFQTAYLLFAKNKHVNGDNLQKELPLLTSFVADRVILHRMLNPIDVKNQINRFLAVPKTTKKAALDVNKSKNEAIEFELASNTEKLAEEQKAKEEAEALKLAVEQKAKEEAEALKLAAEKKAKDEAEALKLAAEKKAKEEAEALKLAAEQKAKEEAEALKLAAEKKAKDEAEAQKLVAEKKAKDEAEALKLAAEQKAKDEAEAQKLVAEKKAKDEAEAQKLAAEKKAKDEAEALKLAAEQKAKEEAEAQKLAAEQKAKEEAEIEVSILEENIKRETTLISNDDFIEFTIERVEEDVEQKEKVEDKLVVEKLIDKTQITEKVGEKKVGTDKTPKDETLADKILREVAQRKTKKADDSESKKKANLINKFINESDKLAPIIAKPSDNENKAERSMLVSDDLVSEKLADLYVKQKYYDKAISAFDKLILKYPEKSSYFADRINQTNELKNGL